MRRLVLFLLLLATGLAVLFWIDRSTTEVEPPPEPTRPEPSPEPPQGEPIAVSGEGGDPIRFTPSGPADLTQDDPLTGNRRYRLIVGEVTSIGEGGIDGEDVELFMFDDAGEEVVRSVEARYSNLRVQTEGTALAVDDDFPITLQEVEARFEQGTQFSPIQLQVPVVQVLYGDRSMQSVEQVELFGRGLKASGRGLFVDGDAELMRLDHDPVVELQLEDGARAVLTAAGPLSILDREDLGAGLAEVRAEGGARLALTGTDPLAVDARIVRLFGRVEENPDRFVPLRAEAEGQAILRPREGSFRAERATIDFGPDSRPEVARLEGAPEFEVVLRELGSELTGAESEGPLPVQGKGLSKMTVALDESSSFVLVGPASLELPSEGATLTAQGDIRGGHESGSGYATISAEGGARVDTPDSWLTAESLTVESIAVEDGDSYARVTTTGPTHAEGTLAAEQRPFVLDAAEGLTYVRRGESFEVPRAGGVELSIGGDDPLEARADLLRDLIGDTLAFSAEGDVRFENELGEGSGERVVVQDREHAELFGVAGRPARFEHADGILSAQRIELEPTRLFAQDDVRAEIALEDTVGTLVARWASVERDPGSEGGEPAPDWVLDAGGDARAEVEFIENGSERRELAAQRIRLEARQVEGGREGQLELLRLQAQGEVEADTSGGFEVHAEGDRLDVQADGTTRLWPLEGERLNMRGTFPEKGTSFELSASSVEYGSERVEAIDGDVLVSGVDLPLFEDELEGVAPRLRAIAGRMLLERTSVFFSEGAHIGRLVGETETWSLDGEKVLLVGSEPHEGPSPIFEGPPVMPVGGGTLEGNLDQLYAWGGFVAHVGDELTLSGDRMHVSRPSDRVVVTGAPAAVGVRDLVWRSEWFELNRSSRSIQSGRGDLASTDPAHPFELQYESLQPVEMTDTTIQVLREPRIVDGTDELRASWALFWVDPRRWRALADDSGPSSEAGPTASEERRAPRMKSMFGELERLGDVEWLREVYLEGNIEYYVEGDVRARAEGVYVDLVDGHGWLRDVVMQTAAPGSKNDKPLKLRAEWLRHSADGTYYAEKAVATTCTFEVPHYVVRIGRLSIEPRIGERIVLDPETGEQEVFEEFVGWDIRARKNRMVLWRDHGIPLPRIGFPINEKYEVDTESVSVFGMRPLSFGQDAKYGAFVGTTFNLDFSGLASWFNRLVAGSGSLPGLNSGKADLNARYLDKRGVLGGLAIPFNSPGKYWIDAYVDGLFDVGNDRGLVRVPKDERSELRAWYRARGRFLYGEREWLDVVVTSQSDPGVQAEFFERDYLRFEERETYLHWRRAEGDRVVAATAETRLDSFRSEITDSPSITYYDGSSRVASIAGVPILYGSNSSAGYYRRLEGDPDFEDPFADGLGSRDILRFDTLHKLEAPIDLGVAGLRATPFVEGRLSAWDEGEDPDEHPLRAGVFAGVDLATTLFRTFSGGSVHLWTPSIGFRKSLATREDDIPLVPIDGVEQPLAGQFVDLALRSRWSHGEALDSLDIELKATFASELEDGTPDGWLPLAARGTWLSSVFGFPYVISHDGQVDLEEDHANYSRTLIGFRPVDRVDVEVTQVIGRDLINDVKLFDATGVGARYRFTSKWELEGRQTFSNIGEGRLASDFLVRRLGHDFVFEIDFRFVAGEGESFSFNLTPLLLFNSRGFGLLDALSRQSN